MIIIFFCPGYGNSKNLFIKFKNMAFTQPERIAQTLTLIKDENRRLAVSPP
jgi:hypothetical protein